MTRIILALLLLAACAPATTHRLCDVSEVLDAVPAPQGELTARIFGFARFARAMFCPKPPTGATDRLPES